MTVGGRAAGPRYDRFELGPGLIGYLFEYSNRETRSRSNGMATGIEIAVQLRGSWLHHGSRGGARRCEPDEIFTISPAELYSTSYRAEGSTGLQVGFVLYPEATTELKSVDGQLVMPPTASDDELLDLARHLERVVTSGARPDPAPASAVVCAFVARHASLAPLAPIQRAKRELDRHFQCPLGIEHIAEAASMSPSTFSRAFARHFGITPARYRVALRLNEAAKLTWSRPDLSIEQIAAEVGFENLSYFHRAFRAWFGLTPAAYGLRSAVPGVRELSK